MNSAEIMVVLLIMGIASLGMVFQKSKAIFYIEMVFLTLILAMYNGRLDLIFYQSEYENHILSDSIFEKGFEYLSIIFSSLHVPFFVYKFILVAISMFGFGYVIAKTSNKAALSASLIYGFATFEYAWQLKALCSSAILMYALYSLIYKGESKKKFVFLIAIAAEFHFFAVMFFPFAFINHKMKKRVKLSIITITFFTSIFILEIMEYLMQFVPALMTYENMLLAKTFFLSALWQVTGVILVFCMYSCTIKRQRVCIGNAFMMALKPETKLLSGISKVSIISLMIIPFYWYTNVISRVVRVLFVFYSIVLSNLKSYGIWSQIYKYTMILYIVSSFLLYYVLTKDSKFELIKELLDNNLLFQHWIH